MKERIPKCSWQSFPLQHKNYLKILFNIVIASISQFLGLPLSIVAYGPVAKQWHCKQRPFLGSNQVNTFPLLCSRLLIMQQLETTIEMLCFLHGPCRGVIKGQRSLSQLSFDASLRIYEIGSRGTELRNWGNRIIESSSVELKVWLWKEHFLYAVVQWYLACVIQWDCYSSCIKIRCQESASGACIELRTLMDVTVNCKLWKSTIALYCL
jgi:hypothetical protein